MLPGMQANLVSRTQVNDPHRGISDELAAYARREYGARAAFAETFGTGAKSVGSRRSIHRSDGLVRRLAAVFRESLAAIRASPEGA